MKKYEVGCSVEIPEENSSEIKELCDKQKTARSKHVITHDLWQRIFNLLPMTKRGTWSIRHTKTKVLLVKLDERQQEI